MRVTRNTLILNSATSVCGVLVFVVFQCLLIEGMRVGHNTLTLNSAYTPSATSVCGLLVFVGFQCLLIEGTRVTRNTFWVFVNNEKVDMNYASAASSP